MQLIDRERAELLYTAMKDRSSDARGIGRKHHRGGGHDWACRRPFSGARSATTRLAGSTRLG